MHPASLSRIVRRLNLSKQKTRPRHPQSDAKAQSAFQNRGSPRPPSPRLPASRGAPPT
ncbi:hypothetical protein GAY28_08825, partial [Azospirillum brasilense]|nr:hypothetical protein [Azospirillum brasilense]